MADKPGEEGKQRDDQPPFTGDQDYELSDEENNEREGQGVQVGSDDIKSIKKLANLLAKVKSKNAAVTEGGRVWKKTGSKPVTCDYCSQSFVSFASLNTHSKKEHGVNLLQCSRCGKECSSLNLLMVHIKMKHEKRKNEPVGTGRFPCDPCCIKYQTESALILHKYKQHGVKLAIICPFCDRVFNRVSNAENLYNHAIKEHNDKKESSEFSNIVHEFLKFRESSDTFSCKECEKTFESSYKLKSHQYKVHSDREASFLCDKCDRVFKFRGELNLHYQKHHSGVTFVCPDCGKSFNHKYNLDIHIKMVHVKNKSLSCDTCGKLFFIPSKLEHHRRTVHEKLKPWQCECCSFRCAAHGNLNLHRRTQHGAEKLTVADYNKLHGIVMEKNGSRKKNKSVKSDFSEPDNNNPNPNLTNHIKPCVKLKEQEQKSMNLQTNDQKNSCNLLVSSKEVRKPLPTTPSHHQLQSPHGYPTPGVITSSFHIRTQQTGADKK